MMRERNPKILLLAIVLAGLAIGQSASAQVTEEWVVRYNGPGYGQDEATALSVDPRGNVYVAGRIWSGTYSDYATVKYDGDGNELWVARYNGPGNLGDSAFALSVDPWGNVYVTGYSVGSDTSYDYATVKYDGDGNELWVARYNGLGNLGDEAAALSVDPRGNVYVTGQSYGGSGTHLDYATVKYTQD